MAHFDPIKLKSAKEATWLEKDPYVAPGEFCWVTDVKDFKVGYLGPGGEALRFSELDYLLASVSGGGGGGMEQHANEYHTPDMALATHNHDGTYEPADAAIQTHVTGTGSPHTAAGVGADPAGTAASAVAAHSDLTTGVHGVGAGTVAKVGDIAVDGNLSAAAQDAVTKRHAEAHTLGSHSTKAHSELTDVGATDHHSNANDPGAGEKAALAGTSGTPGADNKYVTNDDSRNSDSRAPTGSAGGDLGGTYPNPTVSSRQRTTRQQLTDGENIAWDMDSGPHAYVTLGGNRAMSSPSNLVAGEMCTITIIQDGTGSRTLTWGADYLFPGAIKPTLSATAGAKDIVVFLSDGTDLLCIGGTADVE